MNNVYYVKFYGQDYEKLDSVAKTISIYLNNSPFYIDKDGKLMPVSEEVTLNKREQVKANVIGKAILLKFLEHIEELYQQDDYYNRIFVVNKSDDRRTKEINSMKMILMDPQKTRLDGIAGVLRDRISFSFTNGDYDLDITLQINSRFDIQENSKARIRQPYFLATMLLHKVIELDDNIVRSNPEDIFDYLLIFWYREQLQAAWKKGCYKTYWRFEQNDDRFKGNICVNAHIQQNLGQKNGKIVHSFQERSLDNWLNLLIVVAYEHMKKKHPHYVKRFFDEDERESLSIVEYLKEKTGYRSMNRAVDILSNNAEALRNPYYAEYEELRLTCIRILRDEGISLFDANVDRNVHGILYYLPDLWEEYLQNRLLGKIEDELDIHILSQEEVGVFGIRNSHDKEEYQYRSSTYPDYIFCDGNDMDRATLKNAFMILDAKFKPEWGEIAFGKTLSPYALGDYNKCIRDMVSINASATGTIFPMNINQDEITWKIIVHPFSDKNKECYFYTFPVSIPSTKEQDTYKIWKQRLDKNLDDILKILSSTIDKERTTYRAIKSHEQEIQKLRKGILAYEFGL